MSLTTTPTQNANTPSLATSTAVLASNQYRQGWQIQNQDNTHELYVCLGGTASSSVYHFVLKACSAAHDGTGGSFSQLTGIVFTGAITCYSAGTPSYTVLEH